MIKIFLSLCVAGALFSVSASYADTVPTVSWYRQHPTQRVAILSACRDNPGQLASLPRCINAEKADAIEETTKTGRLHLRALTSKDLPPPWGTGEALK